MMSQKSGSITAFIFDMDGVITDTAEAHFASWKAVFDQFLQGIGKGGGGVGPFTRQDYLEYVDGIPRYDGVRAFLTSRGIELPEGGSDDECAETVHGLGNLKNRRFHEWLDRHEIPTFEDARALIGALRRNGIRVGVFSSSRNAKRVLESAGIRDLFDAEIDGADAAERDLATKPAPDMLVETARELGAEPGRTVVVEDAVSGVEAGARGRFATVVGIDRQTEEAEAQRHALRAHGADLVVRDLRRLLNDDGDSLRTVGTLPSPWDRRDDLDDRLGDRPLAVFLDYDGTLTPIVRDYRKADLSRDMLRAVERIAGRFPTAVISGRDLADVRARVGLDRVYYAGSHGFDIAGPDDMHDRPEQAKRFLEPIRSAGDDLQKAIEAIEDAEVERKTFSVAVHYRQVAEEDIARVEEAVDRVVGRNETLRKGRGKKVFEIQPQVDWDKGSAVDWLLANTRLGAGGALPLYIGDDITDEDAFAVLAERGISVVVCGGERITTADYALEDPAEVGRFLDWLGERATEAAK